MYNLGWAQWNLSRFEFKFDDTRLSSEYKNKIGQIFVASWHCSVSALLAVSVRKSYTETANRTGTSQKNSIGSILFLYYEEILVSSNLNSKLFRFYCVRPNVYIFNIIIIRFLLFVKLFVGMGIMWSFEIIAGLMDDMTNESVW